MAKQNLGMETLESTHSVVSQETGNTERLDDGPDLTGIWCPNCKYEIDPDVCHCGGWKREHGFGTGHSFVPIGCVCGYNTPPVPRPNTNYESERAARNLSPGVKEFGCRCPDCGMNMVKIGIDAYRCTACGEKWEAT